ncbi:MAG: hypothetical protein H7Y09_02620 [Chitinophagaceae bacterium]|nr:hypothetical protein [Anaerolineae bacterium]
MKRLLLLIVFLLLIPAAGLNAQDGAREIGISVDGRNSIEIIGLVQQEGFDAIFAGYVTHIDGLPPEALFAAGTEPFARGEATALFTFHGTGAAYIRSVLENLTTTAINADINFYYSEIPLGASFETLDSFAGETVIANLTARYQTVINVQEPNVGVFMMYGTTEQQSAAPFTLNGETVQFGRVGSIGRGENFGQGFRASIEPLVARYLIVGNIIAPFLPVHEE